MLQPLAPPTLSDIERIGVGATAHVYRARVVDGGGFSRLAPGMTVAVKEMFGVDRKCIRAIELEVAMNKAVRHANIVGYLGFYVVDEEAEAAHQHGGSRAATGSDLLRVRILLEFCEGGSLHHACAAARRARLDDEGAADAKPQGPRGLGLPDADVRLFIYQALKGLHYLHARGIVHRDVKGLNMLLTKDRICKLSDFGAAVDLAAKLDGQFHSMQGTLFWMAPEIFAVSERGLGGTTAADVWSIGATAWELATGGRPFPFVENNSFQLVTFISDAASDDALLAPGGNLEDTMEPATAAFVRRCMRRDPAARPSVDALLKDEYFSAVAAAEQRRVDSERRASVTATAEASPAVSPPIRTATASPPGTAASPDAAAPSTPPPSAAAAAAASGLPLCAALLPPGLEVQNEAHVAASMRDWLNHTLGTSPVPSTIAGGESSSTTTVSSDPGDEFYKVRPALEWWTSRGFRSECPAAALLEALGCPNLAGPLMEILTWGRDDADANSSVVRLTDFIRFAQFFGPFDCILADARELGRHGDEAEAAYGKYGDYTYGSDAPHMLLTWQTHPWFVPTLSQADAEAKLGKRAVGDFVIRFSSRWRDNPGSYTLSVRGERGVSHYRILRPASHAWSFVLAPHGADTYYYDSVEELVAHLREFGVKSPKSSRVYRLL